MSASSLYLFTWKLLPISSFFPTLVVEEDWIFSKLDKVHSAAQVACASVLDIVGPNWAPVEPLNTIEQWCFEDFEGSLNWATRGVARISSRGERKCENNYCEQNLQYR